MARSWTKLPAKPQATVKADHTTIEAAITETRFLRSASRAIGRPSRV